MGLVNQSFTNQRIAHFTVTCPFKLIVLAGLLQLLLIGVIEVRTIYEDREPT